MKDKLVNFLVTNRKPIGYSIGFINYLAAFGHLLQNSLFWGVVWLLIASVIVLDTYTHK